MRYFEDIYKRRIRLTEERLSHLQNDHPEMNTQIDRVQETLKTPDVITKSITDGSVQMVYRLYEKTPVTKKYMCVVLKEIPEDCFIITAYFTDKIKRGEIVWEKK